MKKLNDEGREMERLIEVTPEGLNERENRGPAVLWTSCSTEEMEHDGYEILVRSWVWRGCST